MNIELIRRQLTELLTLSEEWSREAEISAIERDLALDKVKRLYEEIRFAQSAPTTEPHNSASEFSFVADDLAKEPEIEFELTYYEGEETEDLEDSVDSDSDQRESQISIDQIFSLGDVSIVEEEEQPEEEDSEPTIQLEEEEIEQPEEEDSEPTIQLDEEEIEQPEEDSESTIQLEEEVEQPEEEEAEIETEPTAQPKEEEEYPIPSNSTHITNRRHAILSLYDDNDMEPCTKEVAKPCVKESEFSVDPLSVAPAAPEELDIVDELILDDVEEEGEDIIEIEEIDEIDLSTIVIGSTTPTIADALAQNVETIAERFASKQETKAVGESMASSSINDRFLIAQGLFGGDMAACDSMLASLNAIDNFDDCMIYIVEHYDWNPDDEATKLVLKILEQRFPYN